MALVPFLLAALMLALVQAGPLHKRDTACRIEGLFVGGTVVGDGYIEDVATEQDCIDKCNALEKCNAVNYFPLHKACLPQEEVFQGEDKERLGSGQVPNTVYVIVKGCQSRRKREVNCRLQDVLVGGSVVNNAYIENINSEEACIEECKKLENCNAVNYWPEYKDCLPQVETLADPEQKDGLASREEPGTVYIVVKGCNEGIERPANILPAVQPGSEPEPEQPEEAEDEKPAQRAYGYGYPYNRRKRDVNCKLENVLVGGSVVDEDHPYIENVESEEACIEECNKLEKCQAVNYFPEQQACLPQVETLADPEFKDRLASRGEPGTNYIVVKGCTEGIERPANILPPVQPEPEQPEETTEQPAQRAFFNVGNNPTWGRRKRDVSCKLENVLVGGSVVDETHPYIENVASEEACIEECNKLENCNAVNYWAEYGDCLPQVETLADPEYKDRLASREEQGTNYIVVKGCDEGIERPANILPPVQPETEPEQPEETEDEKPAQRGYIYGDGWGRRKRDVNCKLENVLVGGSVVDETHPYIENVASEEACIEECNKLENCNAVNYWAEYGDCLPQVETLADPEYKDRLASREEPGTNYIVVKGCNEGIERPANILPPVEPEQPEEGEEASPESTRRKREPDECRKEHLLVGGELVGEPIDDVDTEQACIDECNKLEACQAVNYFPEHKVCWPQQQSLISNPDLLEKREDELTNYIIVKGCGGGN